MRIGFFGTPVFAVPSLEALLQAGHELVAVVSRPDQPAGRHLHLHAPAVATFAQRHDLPLRQPEKAGADEFFHAFRELAPDLAVVVAYGKLIAPRLLRVPRWGFVNVHPSLLPRHRGPSPIAWTIASGDTRAGVTTMLLDEGMDTGPLLLQRSVALEPRESAGQLERRLAQEGATLLVDTLDRLAAGDLIPTPQDESLATVSPKLDRKMGRIDWSLPAPALALRCRAFDPWPGLYGTFRGARIKVHGLEALPPGGSGREPGTVLDCGSAGISVQCGAGTVALLTELQREGKRRLPADAFLLGERVAPGERFH